MIRHAIIDAGPLVAFLVRNENHHLWAVQQFRLLKPPLLVCEAVLTEVLFLLRRIPDAQTAVFQLLGKRGLAIGFSLAEETLSIEKLLRKYSDCGISLADACLVRMAELNSDHSVLTLDSDFHVYRKHGREPIKLIYPGNDS